MGHIRASLLEPSAQPVMVLVRPAIPWQSLFRAPANFAAEHKTCIFGFCYSANSQVIAYSNFGVVYCQLTHLFILFSFVSHLFSILMTPLFFDIHDQLSSVGSASHQHR